MISLCPHTQVTWTTLTATQRPGCRVQGGLCLALEHCGCLWTRWGDPPAGNSQRFVGRLPTEVQKPSAGTTFSMNFWESYLLPSLSFPSPQHGCPASILWFSWKGVSFSSHDPYNWGSWALTHCFPCPQWEILSLTLHSLALCSITLGGSHGILLHLSKLLFFPLCSSVGVSMQPKPRQLFCVCLFVCL